MIKIGVIIPSKIHPNIAIDLAQQLEREGINSIWYPDEKFFRDCYINLALIAHETKTIRLGVCVTDPFTRHPLMTATSIASLAEVAPNRIWLGMGAGGRGFNAMNVKMDKPATAIRESFFIVRKLLKGEMVDFHGEVLSINNRSLDFQPPENIKFLIATGHGKHIKQLAGEIADAVMLANVTSEAGIRNGIHEIDIGAARGNRKRSDYELISRIDIAVNEDVDLAKYSMAPKILSALRASYPKLNYLDCFSEIQLSPELLKVLEKKDYQSRTYYSNPKNSAKLIPPQLYEHLSVVGNSEEVRQKLSNLISLNLFDEITFSPVISGEQTITETIKIITGLFKELGS